jgi:hypothetical protein
VRLSEELARILPARRKRRAGDRAPREIVPSGGVLPSPAPERSAGADPFDAARRRLREQIPPRDDEQ